jgi:hypothetical protein
MTKTAPNAPAASELSRLPVMAFADVWMEIASSEVGSAVKTAAAVPVLRSPRTTGLPGAQRLSVYRACGDHLHLVECRMYGPRPGTLPEREDL